MPNNSTNSLETRTKIPCISLAAALQKALTPAAVWIAKLRFLGGPSDLRPPQDGSRAGIGQSRDQTAWIASDYECWSR